jgi:8-oxo-dGTP pyrophosphatase MutT (NUDIX family)
MGTTEEHRTQTEGIEFAAGGLVWTKSADKQRLAVVHRARYSDWTLPKGRPEAGESLDAAALREAMEETGYKALPTGMAGTYSYLKQGRLKIVLVWHMASQTERYARPASKAEIDRLVWLSPEEALRRLTHAAEREFVRGHCSTTSHASLWTRIWSDPRKSRLDAALQSAREHFVGCINQPEVDADAWWVGSVRHALDLAEAALNRGDVDGGWRSVHDAERFVIFGMNVPELLARAVTLRAETHGKLKEWRYRATESLWNSLKLVEWQKAGANLGPVERTQLEQAMVESLKVLNEHSDNLYHRMLLVGKQLNYLVIVCVVLLIATGLSSWLLAPPNSQYTWVHLGGIAIAGALGGVASAMYQLSRVGQAKIPEALLYGLVTMGRPLVGAVSALFVYGVIQSGIISLIQPSNVTFGAGLVLGFVAGFSEQFVLSTVAKVSGGDKEDASAGGKTPRAPKGGSGDGVEGVESVDDLDTGGVGTRQKA